MVRHRTLTPTCVSSNLTTRASKVADKRLSVIILIYSLEANKNIVILEWLFERDITIYDCIYEIKFNNNLEFAYFKS